MRPTSPTRVALALACVILLAAPPGVAVTSPVERLARLREYEAWVDLEVDMVRASYESTGLVSLDVGDRVVVLALEPAEILGADAMDSAARQSGGYEHQAVPLQGYVVGEPGSHARLTLTPYWLTAYVYVPDFIHRFVYPPSYHHDVGSLHRVVEARAFEHEGIMHLEGALRGVGGLRASGDAADSAGDFVTPNLPESVAHVAAPNAALAAGLAGSLRVGHAFEIAREATKAQRTLLAPDLPSSEPASQMPAKLSDQLHALIERHPTNGDVSAALDILRTLPKSHQQALAELVQSFLAMDAAAQQAAAAQEQKAPSWLPAVDARIAFLDAIQAFVDVWETQPANAPPIDLAPALGLDLEGGPTQYTTDYALVVDVGGSDSYYNNAGGSVVVAGGCSNLGTGGAAAVIDLAGNDRYWPREGGNPNAGYRACATTGGGYGGAGFLMDLGGHDQYDAGDVATNGGAVQGVGFLLDAEGNDVYDAGGYGTNGGAHAEGVGLLIDVSGHDRYDAGESGTNGGANTGVAMLLDGDGSDAYEADAIATNGGARSGTAILVDVAGNDRYKARDLSVNGGANKAAALLFDLGGSDRYDDLEGGSGNDYNVAPKGTVGGQVDVDTGPSGSNNPPDSPQTPSGPSSGQVNQGMQYSTSATDVDGDQVQYTFDWDDGSPEESTPFVASGQTASRSHQWQSDGSYCVRAYATDEHAAESSWSSCRWVTITGGNAPPNDPWNPSPNDGAANQPTSLTLSWSGGDPDGDAVTSTVFLDQTTTPDTQQCSTSSTTCSVSGLSEGTTYRWRVKAQDTHGAITWGPTWDFTTTGGNQPPTQPHTPWPAHQATDQPTSLTASWSAGDPDGDAVTYTVYRDTTSPPNNQVCNTSSTSCAFGGLSSNTRYYWRVKAVDDQGAITWGNTWYFDTGSPNQGPNQPSNPSPANGAGNQPTSLTVSWSGGDPDGDSVTYKVYLDTSATPSTLRCTTTQTQCSVNNLQSSTLYRWRVRAEDEHGAVTWSPTWSFTTQGTNSPPFEPSNPSPSNGATNQATSLTLSWSGGDPDGAIVTYNTYLDTSSNPSTLRCSGTQTQCSVSNLNHATTYKWRVEAEDPEGLETPSPVWSFTTGNAPNDPPTVSNPTGPSSLTPGQSGTFSATPSDPDLDQVRLEWDWGDGNTDQTSYGPSGVTRFIDHAWSDAGVYQTRVRAEDNRGGMSTWRNGPQVTVNTEPEAEAPWGPAYARAGQSMPFAGRATDPDGQVLTYKITWGDGTDTGDLVVNSQGFVTPSHTYPSGGTYTYCGSVQDEMGVSVPAGCSTIEVAATRVVAELTAVADDEFVNANPLTWIEAMIAIINDVNGIYERAEPDVTVKAVDFWNVDGDYSGPTDCGQALSQFNTQMEKYGGVTEIAVGFTQRDLDGGTVGCAMPNHYTVPFWHASVVQTKNRDHEEEVLTTTHEVGHGFGGEHSLADSWWEWNGPHCTIMWSADENDPSPGECVWKEDYFAQGNQDGIRADAQSKQGRNQQPQRPQVTDVSISGRTVDLQYYARDPDHDMVRFQIAWGDGPWGWTEWDDSGVFQTASHTYASAGDYTIWIDVQDPRGLSGIDRDVQVHVN